MKKGELILTSLIGTVLLLTTIFGTVDIFKFLDDKKTYSKVHHLDMTKAGYEWDYIKGNVLLISVGVVGLLITGLRFLKPDNRDIKKLNAGLIVLVLMTVTFGLIRQIFTDY